MPERIYKLQPDRTIQLRGFDHLGAGAAIHSATPDSFKVSGVFRDAADFAVAVLYDADNFYEHPDLKYLPDFDFDGLTLRFDVAYDGLMPLDSRKYPAIDWPFLDVQRPNGGAARIRLADYASVISGGNSPAQAEFQIQGGSLDAWDRLTLWYQNLAFDYIVPGKLRTEFAFFAAGPGTVHSLVIGPNTYAYTEAADDTSAAIAGQIVTRAAADPNAAVTTGAQPHFVKVERLLDSGEALNVSASGNAPDTLYQVKATTVAAKLASQINATNYQQAATPYSLRATASGTTLSLTTVESGYDANFITLYAISKNERLKTASPTASFTGGSSGATLRVTLDFAALGIPQIRKMWLTFAPRLAHAQEYIATEWEAAFTNWTVTGPEAKRRLQVSSTGTVRITSSDARCSYSTGWVNEEGFYSDNFARGTSVTGSSVTIRYYCDRPHDLWLGTSLYPGRGAAAVTIDDTPQPGVNTDYPGAEPQLVTRLKLATGLAAGDHKVVFTLNDGKPFYFDFLEAAVPGDIPDPASVRTDVAPALDYSTDHTYKLPPTRILWMMDKLGYRGPLNEYIGVFWWNQRTRIGGVMPAATITFSGSFLPGDGVFLDISGQLCRKAVLSHETPEDIAQHFQFLINAEFTGIWASSSGASVTITARSAEAAYRAYRLEVSVERVTGSTGTFTVNDALASGASGQWQVDPNQAVPLNRGARDWHLDFYKECKRRNLEVTSAASMELVNPPAGFAACFPGGEPVITSVGFGGLSSTHCAFNSAMLAFHKQVYACLAGLMTQAGLTPGLQFGEFCWWYFTNYPASPTGGMAYYDPATAADAQAALGRPLHIFRSPDDDPAPFLNDALFLRNRLRDYAASLRAHVAALYPGTKFEVLFPYDVNHPVPAGVHNLGGRLNRFVNLPVEWESKPASGFDRFKLEALDFGAWSRNLDLSFQAIQFPVQLGWPRDSIRIMVPVFRGSYPWEQEITRARDLGLNAVNLWAFDHVCLYGWPLNAPPAGSSSRQG
ncbi:MAG: hypothetical protein IT161_02650 [Bryobacterales bacterium]|nr:hypothetical protein [Bryobacterales bacterium]